MPPTRPGLIRERRLLQGWTQAELARRVGLSRQAFNAIEGGRAQPSVDTALALARLLGCAVERLFVPPPTSTPPLPSLLGERPGARFWLTDVGGQVHPHRLEPSSGEAADAVVDGHHRLELLDPSGWRGMLLLAGCDPALRTLALRAGGARWMPTGTGSAVSLFVQRRIHVAGVHSLTEHDRRRVRGAVALHLATWPLGFAVRRGNPLGILEAGDLGRPEVRMVNRERGASARLFLDRMLREAGVLPATVRGYRDIVLGHDAVAQAVALGAADVGITTQAAAQGHSLDFRQLSEESFNLLVRPDDTERVEVRGLLAAGGMLLLLVLPLVALVASTSPADFIDGLRHPLAVAALKLSLVTTTITLALTLLLGTPLAWWLARHAGWPERVISTLVQLPIVVPPAVSGLALLLAFGRKGMLGPALERLGWSLPFTTAAVVVAELFVASPFFIQSAVSAFRRLDDELLTVASTLGAGPATRFFRVALPLTLPGLGTGAALSWARALGEFGATLMFAGNLSGRTQTLPLAIYTALETDLRPARALSLLLVAVALAVLLPLGRTALTGDLRARPAA